MSSRVRNIVIVGGGSAGWLTAGVLAAEHDAGAGGARITLIESPDVNPVGVGEGTWPSMRDTLRKMGVSETEFIRQCDVSFKQASKFVHWVTGEPGDYYYHPFSVPAGFGRVDAAPLWRQEYASRPYADVVSFQPQLCEQGRAPKQAATPEFAAVANYAYHLDAGKFGQFLQAHCTTQLGVKHVLQHVKGIRAAENGDIAALRLANDEELQGDLFIDCTGFSSMLLGGHFGIPFVSRSDELFCDTAQAVQVPYTDDNEDIASHTISTAQSAGWIWDIGLPARRGTGHVYSSAHTSDEQAVRALESYVRQSGGDWDAISGSVRKISINPGHREIFWHRNCVAVGIAAGFIEPLEASALALIEMSAAMIADDLPATRELMDSAARRFNERALYRWGRIIDFLKLHYVLSQRNDSEFWVDNRHSETISPRLQEQLEIWKYRSPSRRDFHEIEEIFPAASYQFVLHGMGFEQAAEPSARRSTRPLDAEPFVRENSALAAKYLAGLPSNRALIEHVIKHGLRRI